MSQVLGKTASLRAGQPRGLLSPKVKSFDPFQQQPQKLKMRNIGTILVFSLPTHREAILIRMAEGESDK